jgi:hypothetical protein
MRILSHSTKFLVLLILIINVAYLSIRVFAHVMEEYVEYYYFPVMQNGELIQVEKIEEDVSIVSFSAVKLRDCDWIKTEWFYGDPEGAHVPVEMAHLEPPAIRGEGEHLWENTRVGLSKELIEESSFVISTHECNPYWKTKSLVINTNKG